MNKNSFDKTYYSFYGFNQSLEEHMMKKFVVHVDEGEI